jgi:hypothetical protein
MSNEISTGRLRSLVMEADAAATAGKIDSADSAAAKRALDAITGAMKVAATLRPIYGEVLAKATRDYAGTLNDALPRRISGALSAKEFKELMRLAAAEHKETLERVAAQSSR